MVADFLLTETDGKIAKNMLETGFKKIDLVEHYNSYYKYKVLTAIEGENDTSTNGAVLSFVMEIAQKHGKITEYAASKTTLEQIFNALVSEDNKAAEKESQPQVVVNRPKTE